MSKDTNYYMYFERCRILNYAAEENLKLFLLDSQKPVHSIEEHLKGLGLFQASLLLRAIAIENLIKSRVLYKMEKEGRLADFSSIKDVINKEWGKKGAHNVLKLCESYDIKLNKNEYKFVQNHIDHMHWAGRFPWVRFKTWVNSG